MNRNLRRCCTYVILALLFLNSGMLNAQTWKQPMADGTLNFYQIQQQFQHDMRWKMRKLEHESNQTLTSSTAAKGAATQQGEEDEVEMGGFLSYKRWEDFMAPRVYPTGDLTLPSTNWARFEDYLNNNPAAMQQYQQGQNHSAQHFIGPQSVQSSSWVFAGPTGAPAGAGAGRVGFIRVDPTNANNLWIGAPAGGLWKSTNGGASWTTNTDFLTVIGASDVVIDPTNTQIMYLATGDGDAGDTYSTGVLKSTDGGNTWAVTGLNWSVNQGRTIRKLLINPTTPGTIMAFASNGIWRTTNSGTSWTQVLTNSCTDAEFMPGTPATVYACGTSFFKSTDGGATWTTITSGVPAAGSVDRLAIAVTAANTAYVYLVAGSAANDGFFGFYKSTNSGTSFTQVTVTSPSNIMGWASAGNDTGGQGWYDLVIAASPTNANEVCVGGVNVWRTTNGGTSWTLNAHWTGTGAPYVHADHHAMIYTNGTTMYEGCDGGIFKTTNNGTSWTDISNNLCIAQIYRIGQSASNATLWITGHQDNGTNIKNGAAYTGTMGGDGMDCFIDRTNNNVMYGEQYSGSLNRTTNGGTSWTGITTGLTGNAPWVTPWYQDPTTANTIYCGRTLLFKSTNQGTNWAATTGAVPGTGTIVDFKVAPSNNQVIYVVKATAVYKTTNGGGAWTTITGTLPVGSATISRVDVKPTDPLTAIVTFSGYSSGNKVFKTTNGGTSWTNISSGLPNLPCNCVRFDAGSSIDAVYVGCDVGVYYMDNTFTSWQPYFTSLPNVPVFDLEVYVPTGKLRAASYGRGVWEVDIYNPGTLPPLAQFAPSTFTACVGTGVNFTDQSSFAPTSWSWTFPGGTPSSSSAQNPSGVVWNTAGTYTITLTCSNANGNSTTTKVITVLGSQAPPLVEGFETVTFLPTGWTPNNINNDGIFWTQANTGNASAKSALFDNYNNDVAGAQDEMWAPRLNCISFTTLSMTFDVAYARYDATYSDSLEVLYSINCGASWNSVYLKGGGVGSLATAPDQTASLFVPTAAQWRNETVNLNAAAGQGSVLIIFRNRGHYGQGIYVDNVNITGTASSLPSATFTASATSVCAGTPVNFTDGSTGSPTSWSWTFPSGTPASATTQNVTGVVWNTAGTYTVTHTATSGAGTGTTTQVITVNALPTVTTTTTGASICSGSSTTITGAGATTYSWMPGNLSGTTVTVSPTTTTTYTVTGTGANGCTNTATRTITVTPTPTVTTTTTGATICNGSSTTITGNGATTYSWMPGNLSGTTVTVSPTTTTTYTVTGTTSGCTGTATRTITVNPSPTVTTTTTGATICSGNSTSITGNGGTSYSWMPGNLSGTTVTVSPATTTTYTVTGTAANGCTGTATRTITVNPTPTVTATASSPTICTGNGVVLTGSGATTYLWNPGAHNGSPWTVTPAATTTYTVTGTSTGCSSTATVTVTVGAPPTVTATAASPSICTGSSTTLTGSGAATYTWAPGSLSGTTVTVSPTTTTTYTVTGSSGPGCSNTFTVMVTVNPLPTVSTTTTASTICAGNSTTIAGQGASTYTWMPGSLSGTTVTVSPTTTTTYTVTGTSAAGCSNTSTRTITVNPAAVLNVSPSAASICPGDSVNLDASPVGSNTFSWSPATGLSAPNAANTNASPAVTTTYTVTKTTLQGCTASQSIVVTVNPTPTVTATASASTICSGTSVTLNGSGATTYSWMPGNLNGVSVTDNPSATTTYTLTGTDATGCSGTATVAVTVNASPGVSASVSSNTVCAGTTVTLTGTGAASYDWQPVNLTGASVNDTPVSSVTYTLTGTAANGCTATATANVTVNALPLVVASASNNAVCTGTSITLTGSGASTYNWQPINQSGPSATDTPVSSVTYTLTGTDVNGCINTDTADVVVYAQPTISVSGNNLICPGASVTLLASGASTYSWQPGGQTTASITDTPISTMTYTVTGTDVSGCFGSATYTVTIDTPPAAPSVTVNGNVLSSSVSGTSYQWFLNGNPITGATSQSYTATQNGSYTVEVYDAAGCGSGQSSAVVDPTGIAGVSAVDFIHVLPNPNNGQFMLSFHVSKADNFVLEIHDMLGQIVYSEALNNFKGDYNQEINLSMYGKGMYTIRLKSSDKETVIKTITY